MKLPAIEVVKKHLRRHTRYWNDSTKRWTELVEGRRRIGRDTQRQLQYFDTRRKEELHICDVLQDIVDELKE